MKKQYKDIRLRQGSPEWKAWRDQQGIGGSEVASVMATVSKELADLVYMPPLKLFLQKIGEPHIQQFTGNIQSESGHCMEHVIMDYMKYYELDAPDQMKMFKNKREGIVVNGVRKPNNVVQNLQWPWMYFSPDAFLCESPQSQKRIAILESKNTTSMESRKYSSKINPAFYLQVQAGLMITGLPVGYACILIDGCWLEIVPIYPDKEIHKWIEETVAQFWIKVVKARKLKIEYELPCYFQVNPDTLTPKQREGAIRIAELEPNLTGSEPEVDFIRGMIIPQAEETPREGTQEEWVYALNYLKAGEEEKGAKARKNIHLAEMLSSLNGVNVINFDEGKNGFYSYKPDKNGRPSIFVSPKLKT